MDDDTSPCVVDLPTFAPQRSDFPDSLAEYFQDDTEPDEQREEPRSLVDQVGQLVASVRDALPDVTCRDKLGCAHAVILMFDKSNSDAKKELLV